MLETLPLLVSVVLMAQVQPPPEELQLLAVIAPAIVSPGVSRYR
jgi:hypothetical protein